MLSVVRTGAAKRGTLDITSRVATTSPELSLRRAPAVGSLASPRAVRFDLTAWSSLADSKSAAER